MKMKNGWEESIGNMTKEKKSMLWKLGIFFIMVGSAKLFVYALKKINRIG